MLNLFSRVYGAEPISLSGLFEFISGMAELGLLLCYHGTERDQKVYHLTVDGAGSPSSPLEVTFNSDHDYGILAQSYGRARW